MLVFNFEKQSKRLVLLPLLIVLSIFVSTSNSRMVKRATDSCGEWCYNEEEKYGDLQCDAPDQWIDHDCISGDRQSPIDIPVGVATASSDIFLSCQYGFPSTFELVNNGHAAVITPLNSKELIMTGSNLEGPYVVDGLHFHWGENNTFGSEHKLSGQSFAMELHIVHHSQQYSTIEDALASDDPSSVAVLGIFFEVTANEDSPTNEALLSISQLLSTVEDVGVQSQGFGLKISKLIPSNSETFNYQGSLTTPCCNQNVFWTVFKNPVSVSIDQMTAFRSLKFHNSHVLQNNYREPQALNGRNILQTFCSIHVSKEC